MAMFLERLNNLLGEIDGAVALSLVADDGIPVESVAADENLDLEALAAELMSQVQAIGSNHDELGVGEVEQFSMTTDRFTVMISEVAPGYFLLLVVGSGSLVGQARFKLRVAGLGFQEDLVD